MQILPKTWRTLLPYKVYVCKLDNFQISNHLADLAITIPYSGFSASAGHVVTLGIFRIHHKANDTFKQGKNKQPNGHLVAQSTSSGLSQHILTSLFSRVTGHKRTKQLLSFSVRCCKLFIFPVLLFKGLRDENESSLTCLKLNIFLFLQPCSNE